MFDGETVWDGLGAGWGATGGGVSSFSFFSAYQAPTYVSNNGGSTAKRNVPDVAAVADPLAGVAVYSRINGGWLPDRRDQRFRAPVGRLHQHYQRWGGVSSRRANRAVQPALVQHRVEQRKQKCQAIICTVSIDGTNGNAQLYGTPGYNAGNFNITYCNCCGNGTPWGGGYQAWVALQSLATGGAEPGTFFIKSISAQSTSATLSWTPSGGPPVMLWRHILPPVVVLDSLCNPGAKAKIDRLGTGDDL